MLGKGAALGEITITRVGEEHVLELENRCIDANGHCGQWQVKTLTLTLTLTLTPTLTLTLTLTWANPNPHPHPNLSGAGRVRAQPGLHGAAVPALVRPLRRLGVAVTSSGLTRRPPSPAAAPRGHSCHSHGPGRSPVSSWAVVPAPSKPPASPPKALPGLRTCAPTR